MTENQHTGNLSARQELLALAERCEGAGEPRRSLDSMIEVEAKGFTYFDPPAYTASLDAAVTLVPEGVAWYIGRTLRGKCVSKVYDQSGEAAAQSETAATPALALCAAALRARAGEA